MNGYPRSVNRVNERLLHLIRRYLGSMKPSGTAYCMEDNPCFIKHEIYFYVLAKTRWRGDRRLRVWRGFSPSAALPTALHHLRYLIQDPVEGLRLSRCSSSL